MRKLLLATLFAAGVFAAGPGQVLATVCINANKPDGAGNFGDVVVDLSGSENPDIIPTNPGGQTAGGFVDVLGDLDGDGTGDIVLVDDTYVLNAGQPSSGSAPGLGSDLPELPEGAHDAAGCGQGVDHAGC